MIPFVAVRARRGKLVHAVSQGADSPRVTFCNRSSDSWLQAESTDVTCPVCKDWCDGRPN